MVLTLSPHPLPPPCDQRSDVCARSLRCKGWIRETTKDRVEGVSWLCFSSHFRVLGNKRSSLSKGYTSIDHGCEDGLDGIWNEARDQIMKIDSIMNISRIAGPGSVMGSDGAIASRMGQTCRLVTGLCPVVGQGCTKGMFQERDRPSQMKHAELKNRPCLFRVSF